MPEVHFRSHPQLSCKLGMVEDGVRFHFYWELVEKQRVILPVWHNVTAKDVYEYSPVLADRVAVNWSLGVDEVGAQAPRSDQSALTEAHVAVPSTVARASDFENCGAAFDPVYLFLRSGHEQCQPR